MELGSFKHRAERQLTKACLTSTSTIILNSLHSVHENLVERFLFQHVAMVVMWPHFGRGEGYTQPSCFPVQRVVKIVAVRSDRARNVETSTSCREGSRFADFQNPGYRFAGGKPPTVPSR